MHKHFWRVLKFLGIVSVVILVVILNFTTPSSVGPLGVLVFFTTLFVLFFCVAVGGARIVYRMMGKKGWGRKDFLYCATWAFAPLLLLIAQSFGDVNAAVAGLIVAVEGLMSFLIYKKF